MRQQNAIAAGCPCQCVRQAQPNIGRARHPDVIALTTNTCMSAASEFRVIGRRSWKRVFAVVNKPAPDKCGLPTVTNGAYYTSRSQRAISGNSNDQVSK